MEDEEFQQQGPLVNMTEDVPQESQAEQAANDQQVTRVDSPSDDVEMTYRPPRKMSEEERQAKIDSYFAEYGIQRNPEIERPLSEEEAEQTDWEILALRAIYHNVMNGVYSTQQDPDFEGDPFMTHFKNSFPDYWSQVTSGDDENTIYQARMSGDFSMLGKGQIAQTALNAQLAMNELAAQSNTQNLMQQFPLERMQQMQQPPEQVNYTPTVGQVPVQPQATTNQSWDGNYQAGDEDINRSMSYGDLPEVRQ